MKISEKTAYDIYMKEVGSSLQSPDLELSPETRRKVFLLVLIGHLIFFSIPFLISYLARYFVHKKPPVIKVNLVEEQKAVPLPPPPKPESPKPEPPKPEPPKPEIPKPEPKIDLPKPEPKPQPEKPKPEAKVEPKPEPKPEKPVVKVPEEKPQPQKPQWKPRDPKQITVSREVVKVTKPQPQQPPPPDIDASKIKERLMKIQSQMKVTTSPSTPTASQPPADYFDRVAAFLYEQWIQPSKVELRGAKPKVGVTIQVDATGRIISSAIKKKSGIPAMDNSVEQLLKSISSLPPPPAGGLTFDVSLEISD